MNISLYTDGSSLGNPGPGGFGAVVEYDGVRHIVKGGEDDTTNNRMEMSAVIAGLAWIRTNLPDERIVRVVTDSSLIVETINKGWKRKKNLDLWEKLDRALASFEEVTFQWVRGHMGHEQNTLADKTAVSEAKKRQRALSA